MSLSVSEQRGRYQVIMDEMSVFMEPINLPMHLSRIVTVGNASVFFHKFSILSIIISTDY